MDRLTRLFALTALCLSACAAEVGVEGEDELAYDDEELVSGGSFGDHAAFAARSVVQLVGNASDGVSTISCSGTLVTPRLVLTALHCFRNPANGAREMTGDDRACFVEGAAGENLGNGGCGHIEVEGGSSPARITHVFAASVDPLLFQAADVAIAVLDRRITTRTPLAAPTMAMWLEADQVPLYWATQTYAFMGWGQSGVPTLCTDRPVVIGASPIARALQVHWPARLDLGAPITWQGPPPTLDPNRRVFHATAVLGTTGMPLPGDSGGPLVLTRGDEPVLVGVLQGGGCDGPLHQTASWNRLQNPLINAFVRRIALRADGTLRGADVSFDDPDGDGVASSAVAGSAFIAERDNCPSHANADQLDSDRNGRGDVCEPRLEAPIITARAVSSTELEVSWDDVIRTIDTYEVRYRATGSSASYFVAATIAGSGTVSRRLTQRLTGLSPERQYDVQVCAQNGATTLCSPWQSLYTLAAPLPPRRPRTCPNPREEPCGPRGRCISVDLCE